VSEETTSTTIADATIGHYYMTFLFKPSIPSQPGAERIYYNQAKKNNNDAAFLHPEPQYLIFSR
jgi:hypothetical protein